MKTALWIVLGLALMAALLWWLPAGAEEGMCSLRRGDMTRARWSSEDVTGSTEVREAGRRALPGRQESSVGGMLKTKPTAAVTIAVTGVVGADDHAGRRPRQTTASVYPVPRAGAGPASEHFFSTILLTDLDDFCCVLWIGDSLKDIVKDSERSKGGENDGVAGGDTTPSLKGGGSNPPNEGEGNSTQPLKEGESHEQTGNPGLDVTPPRAPDAGSPGRVVPPLSAWLFGIFDPQGRLIGAGTNKTEEECEAQLGEDRRTHAGYLFSPCVEIRAEREVI